MTNSNGDAIDVLSKVIVDTVRKEVGAASFDRSMLGVVTAVNGNTYTISVFGSTYNITSDQVYTVGQSVVVTALQGDMKRLVCSPDNVGTMATVNSSVKTVDEKLNSFIDEDFANMVTKMDDRIADIQDQVDSSFMTWFYDGEPTTENTPAKDWNTEDAKQVHLGDLYYDTHSGYSYKWIVQDGVYQWVKETSSGIQSALEAASKAQDTADGKRRTFYATPSPPYDEGDVWMQGESGDLLICKTPKKITESYALSDWTKSCKYTDDTAANKAQSDVNALTTRTETLETNYADTKQKVDNKVWLSDIKQSVGGAQQEFDEQYTALKGDVETLQTDVTQLKADDETHTDDITELKKNVASHASALILRPTKTEAKNYAATAQDAATTAASTDATKKADAAKTAANEYTDGKVEELNKTISALTDRVVVLEEAVKKIKENLGIEE